MKFSMKTKIIPKSILRLFLAGGALVLILPLQAAELPRLPKEENPQKKRDQASLPNLAEPYVSTSPEDLADGLQAGKLELPGTQEAVSALMEDDKAGKYNNLESILLWKDGKLIFEYYNRHGRMMKSGLRWEGKDNKLESVGESNPKQKYFQFLFENTAPVAPQAKEYKYTGTDPSMIMMILDIKTNGKVQDFIKTELAEKFGLSYTWEDQGCGIPKCGAGASFTSRSLIKIGSSILQGGKYNGEQLLSADYVKEILAAKGKEATKNAYFYYFHNESYISPDKKVDFISGVGAGGQYMAVLPDLNLVAVATADIKKDIKLPLDAILEHLIPLFKN